MATEPSPARLCISAAPPLYRAGLERIAMSAGFQVTDPGDAAIGVRTEDHPPTGCMLEVVLSEKAISIRIGMHSATPLPRILAFARQLVMEASALRDEAADQATPAR